MDRLVIEYRGELYVFKEGGDRGYCELASTDLCEGCGCGTTPFGRLCKAAASYYKSVLRHWVKLGGHSSG